EYENFLDNTKPFNADRNSEYQARIAKLDLKINEQRLSQVTDLSHRAAPGADHNATSVISGQVHGLSPETAEKQVRAYDLFLRSGISAVRRSEEFRTYAPMSAGAEATGQYLVPVSTGPDIEKKMKSAGQILTVLRDLNSTT